MSVAGFNGTKPFARERPSAPGEPKCEPKNFLKKVINKKTKNN